MTSYMFLRLIPTHFYLQCSEGQVSMTIPCHFVSVVRRISWALNLVVGQVFVLWFIQREEAHRAVVVETDFTFRLNNKQIKQRKTNSSIRYWDQHIPAVLSLPHRWDLKPFSYFLSLSTHTFPQTLQPPHRHTDTWSQWPWVLSMPTQCNLHLPSLNERERRSSSTPLATSDPPQCGSLAMADFQRGSAIRI